MQLLPEVQDKITDVEDFLHLLEEFAKERMRTGKGATFKLNDDFLVGHIQKRLKKACSKRDLGCLDQSFGCWIAKRPNSRFEIADDDQEFLTYVP